MSVTPAYSDGYLGGRAGAALSENPHPAGSPEHVDWRRAWLKAEADTDAENETRHFREPKR